MKFAETLGAHITPEWRKQYIQYEELKAMVYAAIEEAPAAEAADQEELQRYFASFDEKFFTFCDKGKLICTPRLWWPMHSCRKSLFKMPRFQS